MRWVHEECLIRWFKMRAGIKCELCQKEVEMTLKLPPASQIIAKLFSSIKAKHILMASVYGIYVFLLLKRLTRCIRSFAFSLKP